MVVDWRGGGHGARNDLEETQAAGKIVGNRFENEGAQRSIRIDGDIKEGAGNDEAADIFSLVLVAHPLQEISSLIEFLDTVIGGIGHIKVSQSIERNVVRLFEFPSFFSTQSLTNHNWQLR